MTIAAVARPVTKPISCCSSLLHKLSSPLYSTASILNRPFCWCSSKVHRIRGPLMAGKYDFCPNIVAEVGMRGIYAIALLFATPIALFLGSIGIVVRFSATQLQRESYHHFRGSAPEKTDLGSQQQFTFMSWNVCGLPGGLSRPFGGLMEWQKRFSAIAQQIQQNNPDIFCLQEVYDLDFASSLYRSLKNEYAHFYYLMGQRAIGLGSGLLIASKIPLTDFHFETYGDTIGSAKYIKKGFATFTLTVQRRNIARFVVTHMQAGNGEDPEVAYTRNRQFEQIFNYLHSVPYIYDKPIIFAGDFNIDRNVSEYNRSPLSTRFRHGYTSPLSTCTDFLTQDLWRASHSQRNLGLISIEESLDYTSVLSHTPNNRIISSSLRAQLETQRIPAFERDNPDAARSDHHALFSMIRV